MSSSGPKQWTAKGLQKAFGEVDPEDYGASQFQIYFINSESYPSDWLPPVEGTCKVVWGNLPSAAREREDSIYLRSAKEYLSDVRADRQKLVERFVDKPNNRVPSVIRLLGATLKNHMYSALALSMKEPKTAFKLRLDEMIPLVEEAVRSKGRFSKFFEYVSNWQLVSQDDHYARAAFSEGAEALDEIACWFENRPPLR